MKKRSTKKSKCCKKCKSSSFRREPAGIACLTCGFFKYFKNADENKLWRQYNLDKQFTSATHLTQILCAYRQPKYTLKYLTPPTEEELRILESYQKTAPDTLAKCPHAPRWFTERELK